MLLGYVGLYGACSGSFWFAHRIKMTSMLHTHTPTYAHILSHPVSFSLSTSLCLSLLVAAGCDPALDAASPMFSAQVDCIRRAALRWKQGRQLAQCSPHTSLTSTSSSLHPRGLAPLLHIRGPLSLSFALYLSACSGCFIQSSTFLSFCFRQLGTPSLLSHRRSVPHWLSFVNNHLFVAGNVTSDLPVSSIMDRLLDGNICTSLYSPRGWD